MAAVTDRAEVLPRGATPRPKSGAAAGRSYPTSEVRGHDREHQAAMAEEQWRGATPHSRSGGAAVRRYPSSKERSSGCTLLEQP